jgi:hypothetical protein
VVTAIAQDKLAGLGLAVVAGEFDSTGTVYVAIGVRANTADGKGNQAYFFIDGRYIGRDLSTSSLVITLGPVSADTIALVYGTYSASDTSGACCPDGSATVRYHWTDSALVPLDPIPSVDARNDETGQNASVALLDVQTLYQGIGSPPINIAGYVCSQPSGYGTDYSQCPVSGRLAARLSQWTICGTPLLPNSQVAQHITIGSPQLSDGYFTIDVSISDGYSTDALSIQAVVVPQNQTYVVDSLIYSGAGSPFGVAPVSIYSADVGASHPGC